MKNLCSRVANAIGKLYTNLSCNRTFCQILSVLLISIPFALIQKHFTDTETSFWINYAESVTIIGLSSLVSSHFRDKNEDEDEEEE